VKGGLSVDEPVGERWDLALELIEREESFVVLGDRVQLVRHVGWPGADGLVHIAVLAGQGHAPPHAIAQGQVDAARGLISALASEDRRFQLLLDGPVRSYMGVRRRRRHGLLAYRQDRQ